MDPGRPAMLSDEEMIKKIMEGDRHAATLLIRGTEKLVAHIVFKMIDDRNDLIQDIYLKTFRFLPRSRFQSKLSTCVAQISYTTCYDHLKKRQLVTTSIFTYIRDEEDPVAERHDYLPESAIAAGHHRHGIISLSKKIYRWTCTHYPMK